MKGLGKSCARKGACAATTKREAEEGRATPPLQSLEACQSVLSLPELPLLSVKLAALSIHVPARSFRKRPNSLLIGNSPIGKMQRIVLAAFSKILPMRAKPGTSGESALGLQNPVCHKLGSLGDEVQTNRRLGGQQSNGTGARMADTSKLGFSRRGMLGAFAATLVVAAPTYSNAFGLLRGAGDIRRIRMYSGRTGESIDTIYWIEGKYIPEVLSEINHFMRDWRSNDVIKIDARTVDIMAASHRLMDVKEPYMMLSGYRSPRTNAMLRSQSGGVAKNSLHLGRGGQIFALEFRAYGLRTGPQLGRLSPKIGKFFVKKAPRGVPFAFGDCCGSAINPRRRHPAPRRPGPCRDSPWQPRIFPNCPTGWRRA